MAVFSSGRPPVSLPRPTGKRDLSRVARQRRYRSTGDGRFFCHARDAWLPALPTSRHTDGPRVRRGTWGVDRRSCAGGGRGPERPQRWSGLLRIRNRHPCLRGWRACNSTGCMVRRRVAFGVGGASGPISADSALPGCAASRHCSEHAGGACGRSLVARFGQRHLIETNLRGFEGGGSRLVARQSGGGVCFGCQGSAQPLSTAREWRGRDCSLRIA